MGRTIREIFDKIIEEKETFESLSELEPPVVPDPSQTLLDDLTSTSKVALWNLIFFIQSVAIFVHESLFDTFKSDVEKRALEIIPQNVRFYITESLKFQFDLVTGLSDELVFINGTFKFEDSTSSAAIDRQIIKLAVARDINQVVTIKIATRATPTGPLIPVFSIVKTAFESYINKIKIAGTKVIVISDFPDFLKLAYTIEFDPLVMKDTGLLIEDGTNPVQEAIDAYIEGLPADGTFKAQDLTDSIQLARGVISATADVIEAKFGLLEFTDILVVPTETYLPNAGYLITDPSPIVILTPDDYDTTKSPAYQIGDQVRFERIVFEAIAISDDPAGVFDPTKWVKISNLTYIST